MRELTPLVTVDDQVRYGLQPKQWEAFCQTPLHNPDTPVRHIGYGGSAGSGKSYLARAVAVYAAYLWPGSTGMIVRKTKDEVRQNHVQNFRAELPDKTPAGRKLYSFNASELVATFEPQEGHRSSRIYFGYLGSMDDVYRYQGLEFDYLIFEEATHYEWEWVRWLTGNRLRATVNMAKPFCLYPTNPGGLGHSWFRRLFVTRRYDPDLNEIPENYSFVQAKVQDNMVLLDRDPKYLKELQSLPEPYRSWYLDGDWDAAAGLAITQLDRATHLVEPFDVPRHWTMFGGFDWGYNHPWSFGVYAADPKGFVYKVDTITGRMHLPDEICERILSRLEGLDIELARFTHIAAGRDVWDERKARGENAPSLFEQFLAYDDRFGTMRRANTARVHGLNNLRRYLQIPEDGTPFLKFMKRPGNLLTFEQLETLPSDPRNPEDALKIDASEFDHTGSSGDDLYDETRYAMASRPPPGDELEPEAVGAWSPSVLKHEMDEGRRFTMKPPEPDVPAHLIQEMI